MNDREAARLLARITVDPKIMVDKPTIRGMRLTVEHLLKAIVAGQTYEQIKEDFPFLGPEDLKACLLYASNLVENEKVYVLEI
ncbi:MAG: DUF433 domain-containing protein [Saprospirales bacterium]|nr:DUF433 domain-containing protein [Saprospirales bacterium]